MVRPKCDEAHAAARNVHDARSSLYKLYERRQQEHEVQRQNTYSRAEGALHKGKTKNESVSTMQARVVQYEEDSLNGDGRKGFVKYTSVGVKFARDIVDIRVGVHKDHRPGVGGVLLYR